MVDPGELSTAKVLAVARERLMSLPEAARWMDKHLPNENIYPVKVHRFVSEGRLQAVKVGGDKTEGYNLVDRREVEALLEELTGEETEDG